MAKPPRQSWATRQDLKVLSSIAATYLATSVWPRRWDGPLLRCRAAVSLRLGSSKVVRLASLMRRVLGPAATGRDLIAVAREHYTMCQEAGWVRVRNMQARKSREHIEVEGLEHIEAALRAGNGAILWGMLFCGYTIPKAGLHRAGVQVSHLSREEHASSSRSWLGLNVSHRLFRSAETPFLARRVVMPSDGSLGYMKELMKLLEQNNVISITGELKGKQNVETNFLGWREEFATGAPALAYKMKSVLLTCYTIREGSMRYRVVIEPPIQIDHSLDRHEFCKQAGEEFAQRVQRHVIAHPENWDRWDDGDIRGRYSESAADSGNQLLEVPGTAVPMATGTKSNR